MCLPRRSLATQTEFIEQFSILLDVTGLDIVKHAATTADHHQETSTTVMILVVLFEVLGETIDPFREKRNLHFRRTGVGRVCPMLGDGVALGS